VAIDTLDGDQGVVVVRIVAVDAMWVAPVASAAMQYVSEAHVHVVVLVAHGGVARQASCRWVVAEDSVALDDTPVSRANEMDPVVLCGKAFSVGRHAHTPPSSTIF
jgi:hypothetical protein